MAVVAAISAVAFLITAFLPDTSSRVVLIVIGLALLAASVVLATQVPKDSAGRR
jgi:drug/metabolite transporter superfamily protein YnfA